MAESYPSIVVIVEVPNPKFEAVHDVPALEDLYTPLPITPQNQAVSLTNTVVTGEPAGKPELRIVHVCPASELTPSPVSVAASARPPASARPEIVAPVNPVSRDSHE